MILSHKIAIDPTKKQRQYFIQACGTARFVYNHALEEWNKQSENGIKPNAREIKKQFNAIKYQQYPWLKDIHRDAHSQPFANLQKAFQSFAKGTSEEPTFHKKGKRDSFYLANDVFLIKGKKARLPKIGWIKLREELRFKGKIMSGTVSREADRWFLSVSVDMGEYKKQRTSDNIVGIDLGISSLATLSTGEKIEGSKPLKRALKKLRRLSRQHSKKKKGSNNRKKSVMKLSRLHARIKHIRQDSLHKLTTRICRENQAVVIEDLAVKNMVKNRKLSRAISDMGWGTFRRQLEYKSLIYDSLLIIADRWFPSSKMCSRCGCIKKDLKLSDRIFKCDNCGLEIDRDENSAINLHTLGLREIYACGNGSSGLVAIPSETAVDEAGTKHSFAMN